MRVALDIFNYCQRAFVDTLGQKMWQAVLVLSLSAVFGTFKLYIQEYYYNIATCIITIQVPVGVQHYCIARYSP